MDAAFLSPSKFEKKSKKEQCLDIGWLLRIREYKMIVKLIIIGELGRFPKSLAEKIGNQRRQHYLLKKANWYYWSEVELQKDHLIPVRLSDVVFINKEKRICHRVNFEVLVDHRVKRKERTKIDKFLDLTGKQKLLNMKLIVILIVVGVLTMVPEGLEKRMGEN